MNDFKLDKEQKILPGFKVPEGYFETIPDAVTIRLQQKDSQVISLFGRNKKWILSAAAIFVMSLGILVATQYSSRNEPDALALENYITIQTEISDYELAGLLDNDDIQNIEITSQTDDSAIEEILSQNNNLEQYLINQSL